MPSSRFTRAGGTYCVTVVERASSWRGAHELRRASESIECKYVRRELRQLKRGDLDAYLAATSEIHRLSTVDGGWPQKIRHEIPHADGCRDGCKDGKLI